jgi:hypothetical protein
MKEPSTGSDPVPEPSAHLTDWTLEQLVEGTLASGEAAAATAHLEECARCSTELEAYQSLFEMLGELPRFAPSVAFADAVMARVEIAPQESAFMAWLRRLVPSTRRGWAALGTAVTVPMVPLFALIAWIIANPLLSPVTLGQWGLMRTQSFTQALAAWAFDTALNSTILGWAEQAYSTFQTVPTGLLGGALAFLGVAIPLSAWALIRLVRTPVGSVRYAK